MADTRGIRELGWMEKEIAECEAERIVFLRGKRTSEAEHFALEKLYRGMYRLSELQDQITREHEMSNTKVELSLTQV